MTTIQASAPPIQTSGGGSGASGGNDIAAQISRILDKIQQLTQQLKELADSSGSADEKKKQQELIQTQITVLQAQLAALQHQQAEEEQKKQEQAPGKVEGVNSPTDAHQIDIYIDSSDALNSGSRMRASVNRCAWIRTTSHIACAAPERERFLRRTNISFRSTTGVKRFTASRLPCGRGSARAGNTLIPIPASTIGNSVAGCPISCTMVAFTP